MSQLSILPAEAPRLHQSLAHILMTRSPAHAWQAMRDRATNEGETTEARERGSIIDRLLFGAGPALTVVDAPDWRTKAAQTARDEARANGAIPLLSETLEEYEGLVKILRLRLEERGIVLDGESQVNLRWTNAETGVECEGTLDHLRLAAGRIYDLKCVRNAAPDALPSVMIDHGYHIQHAAYTEAVETLNPELVGRVTMEFLFFEPKPPYALTVAEPAGTMRALGAYRWQRACERWAACLSSGTWPDYSPDVVRVEARPWDLTEGMEEKHDLEFS